MTEYLGGEPASGRAGAPEVSLIRTHVEIINKLAEPVTGRGKLVIACFGEHPDQPHPTRAN